jgi:hypothetical protein
MKSIVNIVLISLVTYLDTSKAIAQTFNWAKSLAGAGNEYAYSICRDTKDNLFFCGATDSNPFVIDSTNYVATGSADIFVTKMDVAGNIKWNKVFGGFGTEEPLGITTDKTGNVYLSGRFASNLITFDTISLAGSFSNNTMFIVKLDSNGNAIWAKTSQLASISTCNSIAVDSNSNIYATGEYFGAQMKLGAFTINNLGQYDIFLSKLDSNGNVLWLKNFGGPLIDYSRSINISGNSIGIAGASSSTTLAFDTVSINSSVNPNLDAWIANLDISGNARWAKSVGGTNLTDIFNSIRLDASGNTYVTGNYNALSISLGSTTLTNSGGTDIVTAKLDNAGNFLWAKKIGGSGNDDAVLMDIDAFGDVYLSTSIGTNSISFGSSSIVKQGVLDACLFKYTTTGNPIWAKRAGGNLVNVGKGIEVNSQGEIYWVGTHNSTSNQIFGSTTISSANAYDSWVCKVSQTLSEVTPYAENKTLEIFPVPNQGQFEIITKETLSNLRLLNEIGKVIDCTISKTNKGYQISLNEISNGIYFVIGDANRKSVYQKIIIAQ